MELEIVITAAGVIVAVAITLVYLGTRNRLVHERRELGKALLDIDQLLKQRRDELPRLIGTCRSYMPDGASLIDAVTAARSAEQKAVKPPDKARAAEQMRDSLARLLAAADRDPALGLDTGYRQIKKSILTLQESYTAAQGRFNQQAVDFNARLGRFPGSLAARLAGVERQPPLKAD